MTLSQPKLLALLPTTAYRSLSDADAATLASVTTTTPRTGLITWATLASIWGDSSGKTNKAELAFAALNLAVPAGGALGQAAAFALATLNAGFEPQDPASGPFIATLGTFLIAATAASDNPILQADINAISTLTIYPCDAPVQASDVTTARQILAGNATAARLQGQVMQSQPRGLALVNTYRAAVAANPATAVAPTADQLNSALAVAG